MAKSGFVPAWMKIQSSDKTNGNQKLNFDRSTSNNRQSQTSNRSETSSTSSSPPIATGRQRHHSSDIFAHTTTRHSPFYYYKTFGQCRNKTSNEQQSSNGFDGQSESLFSFSSPHTQSRRSYSRERSSNSFTKNSESNGNESYNGYRSITNSQRRLHSVSSYLNDRQPSNTRHNSTNENFTDRSSNYTNGDRDKNYGNNDQNSDITIKPSDNEQINDSTGFDRLEQDFPSLNGREKHESSSNDHSSSIWNNAASKFRTSHNEPFKLLDRSLSNNSRTFGSNRISTRKDRLLSTPNGLNGTSPSSSPSTTNRSITLELQTNCITQTKNLDKRSDFFNSLKNDSTNEENKNGNKRQYSQSIKTPTTITTTTNSNRNYKTSKGTLLLLSVPETPEEKELLIRMGWKEYDEINYEITDKDKEEYEKRIKLLPKTENTSTALMSALHRRALPCIDIRDLLRFEMIGSISDDDSSDD